MNRIIVRHWHSRDIMSPGSTMAFIPARSGSRRIPGKNIRDFCGKPLLAWAVQLAVSTGAFDEIVVSSDSDHYLGVASDHGATALIQRPSHIATSISPDIQWVRHTVASLPMFDMFCILRPTNPFRTVQMVREALAMLRDNPDADSIRAVQQVTEHPGKMWLIQEGEQARMKPMLHGTPLWEKWSYQVSSPLHDNQLSAMPSVYVQNASLEIARRATVTEKSSISGTSVIPYVTQGYEGYDLNYPVDWEFGEWMVGAGKVGIPNSRVSEDA